MTTSDKQSLLKRVSPSAASGSGGDATISIDETQVYQTIDGFGASLSKIRGPDQTYSTLTFTLADSAAYSLFGLKVSTHFRSYISPVFTTNEVNGCKCIYIPPEGYV